MIGIYAIIIDNKYYIGQSVDIKRRWQEHRKDLKAGTHENKHLQNAYNKYGKAKFEILLECEKEKLNEFERYFILAFMTYDKNIGYNKSYGGETCLITEAFKEEHCIPILQFDKYGKLVAEHYSLNEAIRKNKSSYDVIRDGIKERRKVKGYYFIEKKEYEKNPNLAKLFNWKPIIQFDLQGNLIAEYFNIDKALKETNAHKGSLKAVLNGKLQSTNGYIWRYKEDYSLNPIAIEEGINPIIQLNLNGEFVAEYKDKWNHMSADFVSNITSQLSGYMESYGDAIQQSWELEAVRWSRSTGSIYEAFYNINQWFETRKIWLDEAVNAL